MQIVLNYYLSQRGYIMNLRKYILIFSIVATFFLTISGFYLVYNIRYSSHEAGGVLNKALKQFEPIKEPFNVLMLVIDKTSVNTDTIMVANYNPHDSRISLLSIPRDTKVGLPKASKINGVYYNYDIKMLAKQITRLFDINIKYYASIDISTFRKIIDLLGGVKYTVPGKNGLHYDDKPQNLHIHLKSGLQTLDGDKAEQLLRFRHSYNNRIPADLRDVYDGGDLTRINIQQDFLKELIKQKAKVSNITKVNGILKIIFNNIKETNFSLKDALRLVNGLGKVDSKNFYAFKALGSGYSYYVYNGKMYNNTTHEEMDGSAVTKEYFKSDSGFDFNNLTYTKENTDDDENDSTAKSRKTRSSGSTHKFTQKNPSNGASSFKKKIPVEP